MPYRIEYASSGRSACNGKFPCGKEFKILKGEMRVGALVTNRDNQWFKYRHWYCCTEKVFQNIKSEIGDEPEDIDGWEELSEDDRKLFGTAFRNSSIEEADIPADMRAKWKQAERGRRKAKKLAECEKLGVEYVSTDGEHSEEEKTMASAASTPAKTARTPKPQTHKAAAKKAPAQKGRKSKAKVESDEEQSEVEEEEDASLERQMEVDMAAEDAEAEQKPKYKKKGASQSKGLIKSERFTSTSNKKRGRKAVPEPDSDSSDVEHDDEDEEAEEVMPAKKIRGAPKGGVVVDSNPAKSKARKSARTQRDGIEAEEDSAKQDSTAAPSKTSGKRGRPKKIKVEADSAADPGPEADERGVISKVSGAVSSQPAKRGRPKKTKVEAGSAPDEVRADASETQAAPPAPPTSGKRGRPKKVKVEAESTPTQEPEEEEAADAVKEEPAEPAAAPPTSGKRGRPRKIKAEADPAPAPAPAVALQAERQAPATGAKKRGRPKKTVGAAADVKAAVEATDNGNASGSRHHRKEKVKTEKDD